MNDYLDIKTVAARLGKDERHIRRLCSRGKLPGAVKQNNAWLIPPTADACLMGIKDTFVVDTAGLANVPADKRNDAIEKLGHILAAERFAASQTAAGGNRTESIKQYASANKLNWRTLFRWIAEHKTQGLISLVDRRGRGQFDADTISPDAFELFKSLWLDQRRPSVKQCLQNIEFVNSSQAKGWTMPSLGSMYRLINQRIPLPVQILHREGMAAYEARCAPYIQRDPESIEPGSVWVGDHHQLDLWIRCKGKWVRPWITAWEDMRSRAIVGWHISASPNQTTILLAMKRAIEKYGPPDSVKIDNGKDYDSEMWTGTTKARRRELHSGYIDEPAMAGLYALMGVVVSFAKKYHPQSKPIERFFDTLDVQFSKTFRTYCGKDTARKPDYLPDLLKSRKALDKAHELAEFSELVAQYINVYNNTAHSGAGMDGRSPAQVLSQRTSRRALVDGVLELLAVVWSGELTVGKNGVRFRGLYYGQFNPDLLMAQGKKVRVAYDPDDLSSVHVYDAATWKLITIAEQNRLTAYGGADEESLREAMRQKSRAAKAVKQFRDSRLAASMDLTSLAIKAMDAKTQPTGPEQQQTLRPVASPLNSQVAASRRKRMRRAVRKAAGAENLETVLDIDFESLRDKTEDNIDLDIDYENISDKEHLNLRIFDES